MKIYVGGLNAETREAPGSTKTFTSRISQSGFDVVHNIEEADLFICIDFLEESYKKALENDFVPQKSLLICFEPLVVWPKNELMSKESYFSLVLRIGRSKMEHLNAYRWPQQWEAARFKVLNSHQRINRVVLINGNKLSLIKGEHYSLRRSCASKIEKIDLYGTSWDLSFLTKLKCLFGALKICVGGRILPHISGLSGFFAGYPQWKGAPRDKLETMQRYRISLVIENSCEFLTEKLFDSLFAGCIPIYVGPDIGDFGIPRELVVQVEPNVDAIRKGIETASGLDYEKWRIACLEWLNLAEVQIQWSADSVYDEIIEKIKNFAYSDLS